MKGHTFTRKELETKLNKVLNKTLGEVDVNNVFEKTKTNPKITGIAGNVIEESVLGFPPDNYQRPDLYVDGLDIELKTTGIRTSKKDDSKYEAKEPMSITAVSPNKIINEEFLTSNFWHKLEHMLLVYYHYSSNKTVSANEYKNFYIRGYEFHEFNETDQAGLKKDWEIVRNFIIELNKNYKNPKEEYPRISSELRSKLTYIDTAPKWPNSPRFRLKRQIVTTIVEKYFGRKFEELPETYNSYQDIDNKCHEITKKDAGKSVIDLITKYNIKIKNNLSKSINEAIIVKMFDGKSSKLNKIELFHKFGITGKSITITKKGTRTEDMKLFPIDFAEWTDKNIKFEDSIIYDYFANHQLLCMIFEEPNPTSSLSKNKFIGFKRLSFSDEFIETEVKKLWKEVRNTILENKLVEKNCLNKKGEPIINPKTKTIKTYLNFPKSKNNIIFVRGSGFNANKKTEEVNNIKMYKQYVWIKGSYIVNMLNKIKLL